MRAAVIDLGSNSIRLLIKDVKHDFMVTVHRELETTRLGRGVVKNQELDKESMADTLSVLSDFISKANSMECEQIFAFGTSALREAKNSSYFIDRVRKLGLDVEILSGEEEALLSFKGAKAGLDILGPALVVDIGGGSTELILGEKQILKSESLPVGAVRYTHKYFKSEPPITKDVEEASAVISQLTDDFSKTLNQIRQMYEVTPVGVGGTLTTLSAMAQELKVYDREKIHGFVLQKNYVDSIYSKLLNLTLDEKRKLPGLMPQRADIITAGAFITKAIMETLNIHRFIISETDIMEGYLLAKINF